MQRLMILLATCSISMSVSGAALAQAPGELDPVFGLEAGLTATVMPNEALAGRLLQLPSGAVRLITVGSRTVANTWSIIIARHVYDDPATTPASK
ncbi:MAG: hypothetical protein ACREXP_10815 [Steroidobacteraceae bacterium]